jgi:hypothetical protein
MRGGARGEERGMNLFNGRPVVTKLSAEERQFCRVFMATWSGPKMDGYRALRKRFRCGLSAVQRAVNG